MKRLICVRMAAIAVALIVALFSCVAPSQAQTGAAAAPAAAGLAQSRIDTMLRTGHADPAWFSSSFLQQVSTAQLEAALASLTPMLGMYRFIAPSSDGNQFIAHFSKGTDEVFIHLDDRGKIDGLLFRAPHLAAASLEDALKTLSGFSGTVSYVVEQSNGATRAASQPDTPLAVGSTFKLAVLNALLDEIHGGKRHWQDVVPLQAGWKSVPSGVLQNWPTGTPITLATYATEMISISDNTAADALIHIVGQSAIARYAGSNQPFLTTREMAILKSREGTHLRGMYLTVDSAAGRALALRQVDGYAVPAVDTLETTPNAAVEWHYSVRDLCRLMWRVASLPIMSVNPGVADTSDFARVAYKGGSDAGILNLTTAVTTRKGTRFCFSATVNATTAIEGTAFELQYGAALHTLAGL